MRSANYRIGAAAAILVGVIGCGEVAPAASDTLVEKPVQLEMPSNQREQSKHTNSVLAATEDDSGELAPIEQNEEILNSTETTNLADRYCVCDTRCFYPGYAATYRKGKLLWCGCR
jgi:hypothetical protein